MKFWRIQWCGPYHLIQGAIGVPLIIDILNKYNLWSAPFISLGVLGWNHSPKEPFEFLKQLHFGFFSSHFRSLEGSWETLINYSDNHKCVFSVLILTKTKTNKIKIASTLVIVAEWLEQNKKQMTKTLFLVCIFF